MKTKIIFISLWLAPFIGTAQNIFTWRTVSETDRPDLTWYSPDKDIKLFFEVYRAPLGSKDFQKIKTLHYTEITGDTLFFHVTDTLLVTKAIYQYYIVAKDKMDSSVWSEVMYGHNLGPVPKPQVVSFTATSGTQGKVIELNWKLNYSFTVRSMSIYRSRDYNKGFELIATLPRDSTHYTDLVTVSNEAYYYFIRISDFFGYQMPSVVYHGICTYAEKAYPPREFRVWTGKEQVYMSWSAPGKNVSGYRVYKCMDGSGRFHLAGLMIPYSDSLVRFTDTAVHRSGYERVRYYAVTVSDGSIESNPTDTITIPLPWNILVAPPKEVDFTMAPSGEVRLFWTPASLNSGISGYNVYRSVGESAAKKINSSLLPAGLNTFTDKEPGGYGILQYTLEAVSIAGKPSAMRSSVMVDRPRSSFHLVLSSRQDGDKIVLSWLDPNIPDLEDLYFYRKTGSENALMKGMVKPVAQVWTDEGITPGESYIYTVIAEFRDGSRLLVNQGVLEVVR